MKDLELLLQEAKEAIEKVESEHELNEVKASYLGKKSVLSEIMASMRELSIEEKKELGQKTTLFRRSVEEKVEEKKKVLELKAINEKSSRSPKIKMRFNVPSVFGREIIKDEIKNYDERELIELLIEDARMGAFENIDDLIKEYDSLFETAKS